MLIGLPVSSNVYPACAGIDPLSIATDGTKEGLPRMRGDRPAYEPVIVIDG